MGRLRKTNQENVAQAFEDMTKEEVLQLLASDRHSLQAYKKQVQTLMAERDRLEATLSMSTAGCEELEEKSRRQQRRIHKISAKIKEYDMELLTVKARAFEMLDTIMAAADAAEERYRKSCRYED